MQKIHLIVFLVVIGCASTGNNGSLTLYEKQAARVTIIRDNCGVPHVYGKSDADAVFGIMYAQCEENFPAVERNYIEKLGRLAEVDGDAYLYHDLLMRLIYDTTAAIADYKRSPDSLRKLLDAFADGINFYLAKHPSVKPRLLQKFEPWFPLLFTDGGYTATQTGGLQPDDIRRMYPFNGASGSASGRSFEAISNEQTGSNAFAIAPRNTANGHALLYINPHVSFYFRSEMHMVSEEGLNVYGAVTWGQFFVFQGFNSAGGWMHTSSEADAADLYAETIVRRKEQVYSRYGPAELPLESRNWIIHSTQNGKRIDHHVTVYFTRHGPVVGLRNDRWLSLKAVNRSLNALLQSWQLTKTGNFAAFQKTLDLRANVSTNTMYADTAGNIAYWHGNFIPRRSSRFNWAQPVDGADPATEWDSAHALSDLVYLINPPSGWLQNCNSDPFTATGIPQLNREHYPAYMAPEGENFRSIYAIRRLTRAKSFNLDSLIHLGYSNHLTFFDSMLPPLIQAYRALSADDPLSISLREPIATLAAWERTSDTNSIATTLAVEWATHAVNSAPAIADPSMTTDQVKTYVALFQRIEPRRRLQLLDEVVQGLTRMYGNWRLPWGQINRYQRTTEGKPFNDQLPSIPVGMTSAFFGCLAAFEATWDNTSKGYGIAGNSFVAAVEFGPRIIAKSIVTGGQFADPASPHFSDQAVGFVTGKLKDVYFYRNDVQRNAERTYHPGE